MNDGSKTPPRSIDYYFSLISPWAYIGHHHFIEMAHRHGATIRHHPVALSTVFPESGGLPLAKRHPLRQSYRILELQRWRARRGLDFDIAPRFWPFDAALADRCVLAVLAGGGDPARFLASAFAAVWEQGRNLADAAELARLLEGAGDDAEAVLTAARTEAMAEAYEAETRRAIDAGVFGSPSYGLDGEVFWGQDRLDLLDDALTSGRAPYRV